MALNSVSEKALIAYKEALANFPASHFAVTSLASVIIRLSGREGRVAIQAAQREKAAARPVLTPSQNTPQKTSFRKLSFSKKNETDEPAVARSTFGLKRVSKSGEVTPINPPQEDQLHQTSGEHQEPTMSPQSNARNEDVAGDDIQDVADGAQDIPLTGEALEAVKQMKPAAIGRAFSLGQLRATMLSLGIEYNEAHTNTILGAALLKALKQK